MTEQQQVYRDYAMEDAVLMEKSSTMHSLFVENMAAFTAFDPDLNLTYANNWHAQKEICSSEKTDELIVDEQTGYTEDLEKAKQQAYWLPRTLNTM